MPLRVLHSTTPCESCQYRHLRLFCNLTPEALAAFGALGTAATFSRGATLFQEGDSASAIYVLCTGQVKLSCISPNGKTMILKIAGDGDLLGLGAVLSHLPHEVTAQAIEPIAIRCIQAEHFLAFLQQFGEAGLHAAQAMQSEYRSAFQDARLLALANSAASRLAHVLLAWASNQHCGQGELRFNMALTHEELGSMANLSRETVTRLLGRFRREKLLSIRGASVVLLAPERLRALASA